MIYISLVSNSETIWDRLGQSETLWNPEIYKLLNHFNPILSDWSHLTLFSWNLKTKSGLGKLIFVCFVAVCERSIMLPELLRLIYFIYLFISGGPINLVAIPDKQYYDVGDVITCDSDAFPSATHTWMNMVSNEVIPNRQFTIDESFVEQTTLMRCQAQNLINGIVYTNNLFKNYTVLGKTWIIHFLTCLIASARRLGGILGQFLQQISGLNRFYAYIGCINVSILTNRLLPAIS